MVLAVAAYFCNICKLLFSTFWRCENTCVINALNLPADELVRRSFNFLEIDKKLSPSLRSGAGLQWHQRCRTCAVLRTGQVRISSVRGIALGVLTFIKTFDSSKCFWVHSYYYCCVTCGFKEQVLQQIVFVGPNYKISFIIYVCTCSRDTCQIVRIA